MRVFGERRTGGCLCGSVRFSIIGYSEAVHCHCNRCRKGSGALFQTWVSMPRRFLTLESVPPPAYRSSSGARRSYCAACGSQLFMDYDGDREISVALGTLDEVAEITIACNIFACDRLPQANGFDADVRDFDGFSVTT